MGRKTRYSKKKGAAIARDYENPDMSVKVICEKHNISRDTFYKWYKKYADFSDKIDASTEKREEEHKEYAYKGMNLLLAGGVRELSTKILVPDSKDNKKAVIKQEIRKEHFVKPSATMIEFFLTNKDKDNWKKRTHAHLTGADDDTPIRFEASRKEPDLSVLSDDELKQLAMIRQKLEETVSENEDTDEE